MSCLAIAHRKSRLSPRPPHGRIMAAVGRGWLHVRRLWGQRATRHALQALDDRMLKDIGLTRSEIDQLAGLRDDERWPRRTRSARDIG